MKLPNNPKKRIERLFGKKGKGDDDENLCVANFVLCQEFKWSYRDLVETPIPFVLKVLDLLKEQKDKEKKEMEAVERKNKIRRR